MELIPLLFFIAVLICLLWGYPVSFTLGGVSIIFGIIIFGTNFFNLLPLRIWGIMSNYVLIAVPLFIFMGAIHVSVFASDANPVWIDVRTPAEYASGHINGAINIEFQEIANGIKQVTEDKSSDIRLYCRSGRRSGVARETLLKLGYGNVRNEGGYAAALAAHKKADSDALEKSVPMTMLEKSFQQVVQGRLIMTTGHRAALATFCMVLPTTDR
jgi:phage shock protein E